MPVLNSAGGIGPCFLRGRRRNSIDCLKKKNTTIYLGVRSYSLRLVLLLWLTNPTPLFIVEDVEAQMEIHNFILKSKSLSLSACLFS